jgi:hypothetical protein
MKIHERKEWEYRKECHSCHSILGIEGADIRFREWTDISQVRESEFYAICVVCHAELIVPDGKVPVPVATAAINAFRTRGG